MPYTDAELANDLRNIMKKYKRSARSLSQKIGLPYRSMQNYMSGETRIPAVVLIEILEYLGSDIQEMRQGNRLLRHGDIYDAVFRVFGDYLLNIDLKEIGKKTLIEDFGSPEILIKHQEKLIIASELAVRLSEAYDEFARDHGLNGRSPTIKEIRLNRVSKPDKSSE